MEKETATHVTTIIPRFYYTTNDIILDIFNNNTTHLPNMTPQLPFPVGQSESVSVSDAGVIGVTSAAVAMTLIDALTHRVFDILNYVILSGLIGLFGTIANVINMVVFARIGLFTSANNLNLFSLAVADFGVALTIFLQGVGYALITWDNLTNLSLNLNVDIFDVVYITISWPNMIFIMANRMITPFVAFERCMCVVSPFKVKTLFTTRRSVAFLSLLFGYSIISHIPIFATHNLQFAFQENSNTSKLVLVFSAHSDLFYDICINTNVFAVSFATVILVLIFTLITVSKIKTSAEWRKSATYHNNSNSSGDRDESIVKKDSNSISVNQSGNALQNTENESDNYCTSGIGRDINNKDSNSISVNLYGNALQNNENESYKKYTPGTDKNKDNNDSSSSSENRTNTISKKSKNEKYGKNGKTKMTDKTIDKETRLVKMITLVSVIYMVLYLPEMVMVVVMFVDKRISTYGQYWRLSEVFYSFTYPTGALNSSINILVYYRMSSAFRREFRKLFGMTEQ